jgi:GT2 family glycosyltransferase
MGDMNTKKRIVAVLVLYKRSAEESQTFASLRSLLAENPLAADAIELIVCDNTPYGQEPPLDFDGLYLRDTSNPGLAKSYNKALQIARERGIPWLLLLDQDTTLTAAYVEEIVAQSEAMEPDMQIVALVPKLVQNGIVQSPHVAPTFRHAKFNREIAGPWRGRLYAFNSASVVRVSGLLAIGGFPEKFWLDFLDHATFHLLQQTGGQVFVLRAELTHDLSTNSIERKDEAAMRRYRNILAAEHEYYRLYGTFSDRCYLRIRMLRGFLGTLIKRRRLQESMVLLKAAVRR